MLLCGGLEALLSVSASDMTVRRPCHFFLLCLGTEEEGKEESSLYSYPAFSARLYLHGAGLKAGVYQNFLGDS